MALDNTENFHSNFIGKKLTSIKYYNVNDNYFVFHPNQQAVIDGGVELDFEGQKLVIGWNERLEFFDTTTERIETLLGELEYYEIPVRDLSVGSDLSGRVMSVRTNWNWYASFDEDGEPDDSKNYILHQIVFTFDDERLFQIATVQYDIENNAICNAQLNSQGELLLACDRIIDL